MSKQIVLITGAITGIGKATAVAYAKAGATVVVSGRNQVAGEQLKEELRQIGGDAQFIKADVRHEEDVRNLVTTTVAAYGRIDVAVNNAGVEGDLGQIPDQSVDNFRLIFDTNVLGTLLSMKYVLPVMAKQKSGSIINVSSIAGKVGFAGASIYVASKHAVEGLTKAAALEVAHLGVRVNAVAPGPIQTDMMERFVGRDDKVRDAFVGSVPAQRAGTADEVAGVIQFLGGPGASYINGQSVVADGGYVAK